MSRGPGNGTLESNREAMDRFLDRLRLSPNVTKACKAAGVPRSTVYTWRSKWVTFANQWDEALEEATDLLVDKAWKMALADNERMIMFLLAAHRPDVYGTQARRVELTGKDGGPVQQEHSGSVGVMVYIPDNGRDDRDPTTAGTAGSVPGDEG